ncbi:MAG: rRNA methyltransferase [Cyanobacteria bacterium RYN_339]|nr:rRNA methyltransferase [Cyanobacteria bacterium RYN_339]
MLVLSSVQNPKVKQARSLATRKGRQAAGLFLVEGTKLMAEALAWGRIPTMTFATAAWWADHPGIPGETYEVPDAILAALATTETPDPVVGVFPLQPEPALPGGLVVVAHKLQDPGNLGTIIRSADAAGAAAVVITPDTVDPYSPKAVRASMGSLFHLPVVRMPLAGFRAAWRGPLYAMTLDGAGSLYAFDFRGDVAFLIGNEGAGLGAEDAAIADHRVMIPMTGHAESLNAAMAATICLFEAARQRIV